MGCVFSREGGWEVGACGLVAASGFPPLPHLIGLATAANIGSTGTITGNPQNIYIGTHSGISYLRFAERLMPVALLGLALNYAVVLLVYRNRLTRPCRQKLKRVL